MTSSKYRDFLYPCNLRIKISPDFSESLIGNLKEFINLAFDSFFYNIFVSNWLIDLNNLMNFRRKEPKAETIKLNETILLYPTDLFYDSLKEMQKFHYLSAIDLGITHLPLYSSTEKNLIFLYGEAHFNRKCAVVSTYSLRDFQSIIAKKHTLIEKRIVKESIHEIGHLILGISHCINPDCVMNYSTNLEKVDNKQVFLCDSCHEKLEVIRGNYNF